MIKLLETRLAKLSKVKAYISYVEDFLFIGKIAYSFEVVTKDDKNKRFQMFHDKIISKNKNDDLDFESFIQLSTSVYKAANREAVNVGEYYELYYRNSKYSSGRVCCKAEKISNYRVNQLLDELK